MAAGAFVLAITGVFATKANKKFSPSTSATFSFASPYTLATVTMSLGSGFTTVSTINNAQVYIGLYTGLNKTVLVSAAIKDASSAHNIYY